MKYVHRKLSNMIGQSNVGTSVYIIILVARCEQNTGIDYHWIILYAL